MRARKVVNRVYQGRTYYRWILSIPPKEIQRLGWVDGQPLKAYVRGSTLTLEPGVRAEPERKGLRPMELEGSVRRRTLDVQRETLAPLRAKG